MLKIVYITPLITKVCGFKKPSLSGASAQLRK